MQIKLLLALLALATIGCEQHGSINGATSNSATVAESVLTSVDANLIVKRGELLFVGDFDVGRRLASELQAPALVFFTAPWCTFCHEMEATAFTAPQPAELAQQFVCILVDADREPEACRMLNVQGYPTIQFISPGGAPLHRLVGKQSAAALSQAMHAALQRLAWRETGVPLPR